MKVLQFKCVTVIFSTTLTETEKGYPPAVEHVGVPMVVLREKGAT